MEIQLVIKNWKRQCGQKKDSTHSSYKNYKTVGNKLNKKSQKLLLRNYKTLLKNIKEDLKKNRNYQGKSRHNKDVSSS